MANTNTAAATKGYGICFANGPRVSLGLIRAAAAEVGLASEVARLDRLETHGTRYSNEDFDVLASVSAALYRAGVDVSKGGR